MFMCFIRMAWRNSGSSLKSNLHVLMGYLPGSCERRKLSSRIIKGKLLMNGVNTFHPDVRVLELAEQGFWLALRGERLYLAFADFPWFLQASKEQIDDVQRLGEDHLYWPQLDIDLSIASVRDPHAFPLMANDR